ncbi:hypothetical protein SESBI_37930 [Sesbania bispinosa]|nr:hypothetical protein SESBI_37930 [Sesbania bispinosa]
MRKTIEDTKKGKEKSDLLVEQLTKSLKIAEDNLMSETTAHKTDLDRLKAEIAFQYEEGFDKAIGQVKFLYPDLSVDTVGAFKEIRDGKIVDIPDDEE